MKKYDNFCKKETMHVQTPQPTDIAHKTVIVRVDFNVPLTDSGAHCEVADTSRLERALPMLEFLKGNSAKIVLLSHLGRPKGQPKAGLSLAPVAECLAGLLGEPVQFASDCIGFAVSQQVQQLKAGEIILLENTRFHPEETKNDVAFSRKLAELGDVFINEAFSVSHRAHASTVGIADFLPSFAGFQFTEEVEHLSKLLENPGRPFVMVVGGRKISDKIEAVLKLTQLADVVLLGGGVANNFLKAEGHEVFNSFVEDASTPDADRQNKNYVQVAAEMMHTTKLDRVLFDNYIPLPKIMYPTDVVIGSSPDGKAEKVLELTNGYRSQARHYEDKMFLDIGPKTAQLYSELILKASTVFWNGPMGVFENDEFSEGTRMIAKAIANSSARTILGGGDTLSAIRHFGYEDRYDYVSAAGGAALEFLSGKVLPGVEVLMNETEEKEKK